ncbi:MAG: 50S ribosomal protein L11 methyltransferase [Thermodesulfobacteriota bacterium]
MNASPIAHRPPRTWIKLTVSVPAPLADEAAGMLATVAENGVEYDYAAANQENTQERLTVYLDNDAAAPAKEAAVASQLRELEQEQGIGPITLTREEIIEQDWNAAWKEFFKPFPITPKLIIKPTWEDYTPQADEQVIEMDPGMAFGTGHHASTRLALQLLEGVFEIRRPVAPSFLDVGCGTAILAMAGALWGGGSVVAIDNDPDAVFIAKENTRTNHLQSRIAASDTPLADLSGAFDVVVANITSDVLALLAPELVRHLTPGGDLILAGILRGEQEEAIRALFQGHGLTEMASPYHDEWVAFHFRR